jgi:hypothetical protein
MGEDFKTFCGGGDGIECGAQSRVRDGSSRGPGGFGGGPVQPRELVLGLDLGLGQFFSRLFRGFGVEVEFF